MSVCSNNKKQQQQQQQHNIGSNMPNIPLKRTRAKRSCDFCRKRKARCDADHSTPCTNCKAWGYSCEFVTVRKKRGPPSVYVENLETRCKKMEVLLTSLTNSSIKEIEKNGFDIRLYSYSKVEQQKKLSLGNVRIKKENERFDNELMIEDDQDEDENEDENDEEEDEDDEEEEDDGSTEDCCSPEDDKSIISNMEETLANLNMEDYDSIKYTGHSAGLKLIDQDLFKYKSYVQWPGREDVALKLIAQNELMVVRSDRSSISGKKVDTRLDVGFSLSSSIFDDDKKSNENDSSALLHLKPGSLSETISKKDHPSNTLIEKAIKLYFSHLHTFLPIVDKTRFEAHDMRASNVLTQAVLAVSFRFASRHFPKLFNKKASVYANIYFRKVMTRLQDSYRARLRHVQAALLMTLYLDMDETDVESMQWYTLGKAIRMAQDIGLHRSCSNWNLPRSEIETRHRVFYALYILDRLMGARAGKPLTILDRDFDTELPVPYEVCDDNEEQGPPVYHSFIKLIKLAEILGRILKALYAPKSKHSNSNAGLDDPTILAVFDRRLKNWKATLDQPEDGATISQAKKVNLLLLYYTVMLLLHRPFIEFSSDNNELPQASIDLNTLAADSRLACENAASSISTIVRQKQGLMSDPDSYSPLCLPTCFVYSMFQSSLIHLAIVIKNRDSLRRLRLLQKSIALLKQHEQLASAQRAHNILLMLISINGIDLDNILENTSNLVDEDQHSMLTDDGLLSLHDSPKSPIPETPSGINKSVHSSKQTFTNSMIPSCENTMPKSAWYQRMINTSVVGGITSDLHLDSNATTSSHTLNHLLPYSDNSIAYQQQMQATNNYHGAVVTQPNSYYQLDPNPASNAIDFKRADNLNHVSVATNHQQPICQSNSINNRKRNHQIHAIHPNERNNNANYPSTEESAMFAYSQSPVVLTQRMSSQATSLPFHQAPLPFTATYGVHPTNTNTMSIPSSSSSQSYAPTSTSYNNHANNLHANTLPPSSLNWSDWDVYLDQHHGSSSPTIPSSLPENSQNIHHLYNMNR